MEKLRTYFLLGAFIALPSAYGLYFLITNTLPYLKERWILFFLVITLVTGITLPVFASLNRYFFSIRRIVPKSVVRESVASGIVCAVLLWFQIGRVLTPTVVFLFAGGFAIVEILLRTRDSVDPNSLLERKRSQENKGEDK